MSNFSFLKKEFPYLAELGEKAELYCEFDPNTSISKSGLLAETIVNEILRIEGMKTSYSDTAAQKIEALRREGIFSRDEEETFQKIRKERNQVSHTTEKKDAQTAKDILILSHGMAVQFFECYAKDYGSTPPGYKEPKTAVTKEALAAFLEGNAEREDEAQRTQAANVEQLAKNFSKEERAERRKNIRRPRSEAEVRVIVDSGLQSVGWEVDSLALKYSKGARPEKGKNRAIAEWLLKGKRRVDYALFLGEKLVGFIETKAEDKSVADLFDTQLCDYACALREEDKIYTQGTWTMEGKESFVPLLFASNGRPYLKEYMEQSGIWFLDARKDTEVPRPLPGWMSPRGIKDYLDTHLEEEREEARRAHMNPDHEDYPETTHMSLRPYQEEALKRVIAASTWGQNRRMLLAMATGTGKTRTAAAIMAHLLRTKLARHILYLVDRRSLAEQTYAALASELKPDGINFFTDIYGVACSTEKGQDLKGEEYSVVISTVQAMARALSGGVAPGATDFDFVIVDEAHRGYTLNQEASERDFLDENLDYRSVFTGVLDYFDATILGLTATPAMHTIDLFQTLIYSYSYHQAVEEGYLADMNPPYVVKTKQNQEGISYEKGEEVTTLNLTTGEEVKVVLDDELSFEVDQFNRSIINKDFTRVALMEVMKEINLASPGKTLIFAVNDQHADTIVSILKDYCTSGGFSREMVKKITGRSGGGDPERVQELIRRFKNTEDTKIAVTVDLLTTGVDVPDIVNLVFLRRVKSKILYNQMLGRATRLCPRIQKDSFNVFDCVEITTMEMNSDMRPVVAKPHRALEDVFAEMEEVLEEGDEKDLPNLIRDTCARLQRKYHGAAEEDQEFFDHQFDGGLQAFLSDIRKSDPVQGAKALLQAEKTLLLLEDAARRDRIVYVHEGVDEYLGTDRVYGDGITTSADYLESFIAFVRDNWQDYEILRKVLTAPQNFSTYEVNRLKELLEREISGEKPSFTLQKLEEAHQEQKHAVNRLGANLLTWVRHAYDASLPLVSQERQIDEAFDALLENHQFSKTQVHLLQIFKNYAKLNCVVHYVEFTKDTQFTRERKQLEAQFQDDPEVLPRLAEEFTSLLYPKGTIA